MRLNFVQASMDCRTGFYLIVWGDVSVRSVRDVLVDTLLDISGVDEIPAANEIQCGNYRDMASLQSVKNRISSILNEGFSLDPFERKL